MKAFLPVELGWYETPTINIVDEFANKIAEVDDPMPVMLGNIPYDCVIRYYQTSLNVYATDYYYRGQEEQECGFGLGTNVKLYHEVEVYRVNWDMLPDWIEYVTISSDGSAVGFNHEPVLCHNQSWGASKDPAIRARSKQIALGFHPEVPKLVNWRELIEKRPDTCQP